MTKKAGRAESPPREPPQIMVNLDIPIQAWARIFAAMAFPHQPAKWDGFIVTVGAQMLDVVSSLSVPGDDGTLTWLLQEALLKPAGGYGTLARTDGATATTAIAQLGAGDGQIAGAVLCFALQLRQLSPPVSVSINRAWAILSLDKASVAISKPVHRSNFLEGPWAKWKAAAPLYAALLVRRALCKNGYYADIPDEEWHKAGLIDFLSWAEWFRAEATTVKADKARHPLLLDRETLKIVSRVHAQKPPIARLRPERDQAARDYRRK